MLDNFVQHLSQHGLSYATIEEFNFRQELFAAKDILIAEHNAGDDLFQVAHNKFSTWTHDEYKRVLGYKKDADLVAEAVHTDETAVNGAIDWRTKGAVNPVQDQGSCGSCWAFSSVFSFEAGVKIKHGQLKKFSEQQLVDCVRLCYGCNGGLEGYAFNYYKSHNAELEGTYPYKGVDGSCKYNSGSATTYHSTGYTDISANNPNAMKNALANNPISVAIEADTFYFQHYSTGILNNASKCGTNLDHATAVVGWGSENGVEYWIMRNSWSSSWGESGYARIQITSGEGVCGIQMETLYPTIA